MTIRTSLRRTAGLSAALAAGALTLMATTVPAHATDVNFSPLVSCTTTRVAKVGGGITKFSARCHGGPLDVRTVYWINGKCNGVIYSSGSATSYGVVNGGSVYINCSSGFSWLKVEATH